MKKNLIKVGILAPSSVVPKVEFEIGCNFLRSQNLELDVHPSVTGEYYFYPAPDAVRAEALIEFALRKDLELLWCARGGYGATHLLPYLDKAKKRLLKAPKKTLLGYSDATALLEWFRVNLGWKTIHAPMPSLRTFSILNPLEWESLEALFRYTVEKKKSKFYSYTLTPLYVPQKMKTIEAPLVGGNLFVWNTLLGTPSAGNAKNKILFLEEIQENLGRIHRMIHHLEQAGGLKQTKAIVLGDFLECHDSVPTCLPEPVPGQIYTPAELEHPDKTKMIPLRKIHPSAEGLDFIFTTLGARLQIPIFKNCPVGHGPNHFPLFLGQKHELSKNGKFSVKI